MNTLTVAPSRTRFERLARGLDVIVEIAGRVGAYAGFALLLVMGGNVIMRYLFRTGSVAMQELEWHLMAPVSLLCIAYAIKHEGHIRVDVLYARLTPRWRKIIDLVSHILALVLCVIIIILSVPYVIQSFRIGEGSPDPGGLPYRFIVKSMIPLGFVFLGLQSLACVLRDADSLREMASPPANAPEREA
jgi:TRAP-type mannitol/chloroaromatic compound transport system permease small subunit